MTVVFGALTSAFTGYSAALYAQAKNPTAGGAAAIEAAKAALFVEVDRDVLYLVYIGQSLILLSDARSAYPTHLQELACVSRLGRFGDAWIAASRPPLTFPLLSKVVSTFIYMVSAHTPQSGGVLACRALFELLSDEGTR
jgi:hypothetical protein